MDITISFETSITINDFSLYNKFDENDLYENILTLYALDAFIGALLLGDKVIALTNIENPLIYSHPELPISVLFPQRLDDEIYNIQLTVKDLLKNNYEFIDFYKNYTSTRKYTNTQSIQYIDNTALISTGDALRATHNKTSFFANQLESPICLLLQIYCDTKFSNSPNFIKECLTKAWNENIHIANQLTGITYFTANIPFFLNSILQECKAPEDIWKIALEFRDSKNIKSFRNWLNDLDGETNIKHLLKELNNLKSVTNDVFKENSFFDSFAFGVPLSISLPPITSFKELLIKNKPHFRFYRRLLRDAIKSASFEKEIQRVFKINKERSIEIIKKL
jgi:hypothetical protein